MHKTTWALIAAAALAVAAPTHATTPAEQKAELRKMCDAALADLYKAKPDAKAEIRKAAGYGCFSSFGISFFVGGAGGRGLVHDNATKKTTFMNMGQASGGLDFGIKEYREILVFRDKATLAKFINEGWEFGAQVGATATADRKGVGVEGTEMASHPIKVYPMTRTGLAVGAAAGARKYWKDKDLN
jgi:lipid-binding SYLF domain-containing protein